MGTEDTSLIGTIQLTQTTSLVFSIRPWKGRSFAHVRKFVSGEKYEGATKAGLAMSGSVLISLIGSLNRLKAEAPGVEQLQFAKVQKAKDTEIVVSVIPPDDLKALPNVDVREYVDSESYTGPTKKGVRFNWDRLAEFIGLLEIQARQLGSDESAQPVLFADAHPSWVKEAERAVVNNGNGRDPMFIELLPHGPKAFPEEFLAGVANTSVLELPLESISVVVLPNGKHAVHSDLGFRQLVRNQTEGNFICYAHRRGARTVHVPTQMIEVFRAVKAYENYVRDLRSKLLKAYERKSGHRPMAEHQTKEAFKSCGLPWVE